jgi:hypothetical protein
VALGAMAVLSVVAGWLMAGRVLRPLRRITATAAHLRGEPPPAAGPGRPE